MATVGDDYQPYAYRLDKLQLSQQSIRKIPDTFTAQASLPPTSTTPDYGFPSRPR